MAEPFRRAIVDYHRKEMPGTIVVDSDNHYLYYVQDGGKAIRYGVTVGEEALAFSGIARVGNMAEWPKWTPTADIHKRIEGLPASVPGGVDNPLGARALYLYQGNRDTLFRIHGTNQPEYIGASISSGCIRMTNEDVIDLYSRVKQGTIVVVLDPKQGDSPYNSKMALQGGGNADDAIAGQHRLRIPCSNPIKSAGLAGAFLLAARHRAAAAASSASAGLAASDLICSDFALHRLWRRLRAAALPPAARPAAAARSAAAGPTRPTGRSGSCCAAPSDRDGCGPRDTSPSPAPAPSETARKPNAARFRAVSRGTVRSVSEIDRPLASLMRANVERVGAAVLGQLGAGDAVAAAAIERSRNCRGR